MHALPEYDWRPLIDSHGRRHDYLRISLTDRCNFRCLYCMPAEGVEWRDRAEILSLEEIERLAKVFVRLGVRKIRLTGGEPTVRRGFMDLLLALHKAHPSIKSFLTTNGSSLREFAEPLREAGLSGINISLDSLRRDRFAEITRRDVLPQVVEGIKSTIAAGISTKINVVVMPGVNDDELGDFVEFVRDRDAQVRFIEFMPFAGNLWKPERVFGYADMRRVLDADFNLQPIIGHPSDVAKEFSISGFKGTIGFVTSVTDSFCSGCNRIRLTADGHVKTCLFLPQRTSLRDLMRAGASDSEIATAIRADLDTKWAGHPPMDNWK